MYEWSCMYVYIVTCIYVLVPVYMYVLEAVCNGAVCRYVMELYVGI